MAFLFADMQGIWMGFFWLVGQGGYGIQTAPALSVIAADLILKQKKQSGPLVQGGMAEDL